MGRGSYKGRSVLLSGAPKIRRTVTFDVAEELLPESLNPFDTQTMTYREELYCDSCGLTVDYKAAGENCDNRFGGPGRRTCPGIIQKADVLDLKACQEILQADPSIKVTIPKDTLQGLSTFGDEGQPTGRSNTPKSFEFRNFYGANAIVWYPGNGERAVFFRDLEQFRK